jgi:hypothetical protein
VNSSQLSAIRLILAAVFVVPLASGCVCWEAWCAPAGHGYVPHGYGGYGHHGAGWHGPSMCFGYYPTCWRPWPLECPPCPPFALEPTGAEIMKPPHFHGPQVPPDFGTTPDSIVVPPQDIAPPALPNGSIPRARPDEPMQDGGASSRRHWSSDVLISQPAALDSGVLR